jgi:hypothetical protein
MNIFKTVRQPFFSAEEGGGDDNLQESGKITFTPEQQAEVDRIIGQRITSVKASYVGYEDLKEVADLVKEFGYQGSTADIKATLKTEVEARKKAAELKDLEDEATTTGTSPEILAAIKELKKELAEIKQDKQQQQKDMEEKQKADESFKEQVTEFNEKHPDVDVGKLNENKRFMDFLNDARAGLSLLQVYDKYIDLVGGAEKAAIEKIKANDDRSTFSGKAKADPSGGTYGLTENQQTLARKNDMSFKEYAEALKQIPN